MPTNPSFPVDVLENNFVSGQTVKLGGVEEGHSIEEKKGILGYF